MRSWIWGIAAVVAIAGGAPARAWSDLGHTLVAALAQAKLTPAAAAKVHELLQGEADPTLPGIAMWADRLRANDPDRFKATARWHYVNFKGNSCRYTAESCPDGQCVVGQIEAQLKLLGDPAQPREVRRDALKFVVHLVGDIHQPMHSSNRTDRGGNDVAVVLHTDIPPEDYARDRYKDGVMDTNVHSVWDYYVLASAGLSRDAYAQRLAAMKGPRTPQGSPAKWATESCKLIDSRAMYPATTEIDGAFLDKMRPLAEQRVEQAAIRLARLLNRTLGR